MKEIVKSTVVLCLAAALMSGCFAGPSQLSVSGMAVAPPSLMVAQKSPRVAYIVLDPAKVPAEMPVLVDGQDRGGKLTQVDVFVARDLKRALATYFDVVHVVAAAPATGDEPSAVFDVRLDRVEVVITQTSRYQSTVVRQGAAVLTWSLGLRMSEAPEYLYSFAGQSAGAPGDDPSFVFRSMFESAITDLLKGYSDKQIHDRVLRFPETEAVAAPTSSSAD